MTDIANLGLAIDSSQAAAASTNLDAMVGAAGRAESATKRVESAASKLAQTHKVASVNSANLAAQLQDVAVSLQAGAGPMQVALQQGTQIAMAFGNAGAAGAAAGLASAFRSLVSPVSLLSVGIVALTGYAIQWATSSASATDKATEALKRHDEVLKIIKERYPSIAAERDKAFNSAVGLKSEEVANLRAYQKAVDDLSKTLNSTSKQMAMRAQVMASPAGGSTPAVIDQWNRITAAVTEFQSSDKGAMAVARLRDQMAQLNIDATDTTVQKYAQQFYEAAKGAAQAQSNVSSFQGTVSALDGVMPGATDRLNAYATAMANMRLAASTGAGIEAITNEANKALEVAQTMSQVLDTANEANNILVQAQYPGGKAPLPPTKPNRESIVYSTDRQAESAAARAAEQYRRLEETAKGRIETLKIEGSALGMTTEETLRLQYSQELLNRAQVSGLKLTPQQTQNLKDYAAQAAATDAANQRMAEQWNDAKDATKGFLSDFTTGLRNGENAWKSFGDAANGVLDKIINKIENQLVDALFTSTSSGGFGLGNFLSGIFNFNALGGVYGPQGAMAFAGGGVFSNSVVTKPTLFPFARGTGLMGEAGPEAIMPLARDSAGRLGVKSSGGGGGVSVSVGGTSLVVQGSVDQSTLPVVKAMLDERDKQLGTKVVAAVRDAQARGKL